MLAQMKSFTQHEGKSLRFQRVDFGEKLQDSEERTCSVEIRVDEVPELIGEALDAKLRHLAEQSGAYKMQMMFARMDEATEQTGQRINAMGKPLDGPLLLDMIEMAEGAFDSFGRPTNSFLVHPVMMPTLKRVSEEVERDPELKRRMESIKAKQLQQWIDRENRRKLVD